MEKLILVTMLLGVVYMAAAAPSTLQNQSCDGDGQTISDAMSGSQCTCEVTVEYQYRGFFRRRIENGKWNCAAPAPPTCRSAPPARQTQVPATTAAQEQEVEAEIHAEQTTQEQEECQR